MKKIIVPLLILMVSAYSLSAQKSFYDFTVEDLYGQEFPLSQLKGKKVLVVNTASKCGFTPQYADLQKLYEKYGNEDFTIIGFPWVCFIIIGNNMGNHFKTVINDLKVCNFHNLNIKIKNL